MQSIGSYWKFFLPALLLMPAAWLAWAMQHDPLVFPGIYIDALASYWLMMLLLGLVLRLWLYPVRLAHWSLVASHGCAMLACVVAWPLLLACMLILSFVLENVRWWPLQRLPHISKPGAFWALPRSMLALVAVLAAMTLLSLGGARRFDADAAGAAFTSPVFWLMLLGVSVQGAGGRGWGLGMLYLLARLYTLGPWLPDWSLATLTVGVILLGWQTIGAVAPYAVAPYAVALYAVAPYAVAPYAVAPHAVAPQDFAALPHAFMPGLVLIGLGLGTSAGIAAACFVVLAACISIGGAIPLLPFNLHFVAFWSVIAATAAAGLSIVTGIVWLLLLLQTAGSLLAVRHSIPRRGLALSVVLAIFAPALYRLLIQPVVEQLQGGLTAYGSLASRPWVGLAATNSANHGVMALPLIALAGLLVVLLSALYLPGESRVFDRIAGILLPSSWRLSGGAQPEQALQRTVQPETQPRTSLPTIILLRSQVPWLHTGEARRGRHESN